MTAMVSPLALTAHSSASCPIARVQRALSNNAFPKDTHDTIAHQERVSLLGFELATRLGLSEISRSLIYKAGEHHDIGKLKGNLPVLFSPRRLTHQEIETVVKPHAEKSYEIISATDHPYAALIARIALEHHERLDGTGYPNNLKDNQIMDEAKVLAVADVYDALIDQQRRYKTAIEPLDALALIHAGAGTKYDRRVVEALTELILVPAPRKMAGKFYTPATPPSLAFH